MSEEDTKTEETKTEETSTETPANKETEEKKSETYTVKIAGEEKELTLDELKDYATKAGGADKRLAEAAEIRKKAEEAIESSREVKGALNKLLKSDNVTGDDIRKLAGVMGMDSKEAEEMVKMFDAELAKSTPASKGDDKKYAELSPEDREILDGAKADQIKSAEEKILEMCKESVDKDDFFGKIISGTPEAERGDRSDAILKMVHRDVNKKILASPYTQEKFGTEMIQNSIQTIRSELKKFGIPSKSSKQEAMNLLASLGQTGGLPVEVTSDEEIERVPSTEADYEDNVVKRLGQKMVQAARNRRK